ncbi:hypothetical protein TDB9533_04449 [Thalassocella blandensis]|nr:hypothetical protein TDB9533_04449 [Thalassocella blandensis]
MAFAGGMVLPAARVIYGIDLIGLTSSFLQVAVDLKKLETDTRNRWINCLANTWINRIVNAG